MKKLSAGLVLGILVLAGAVQAQAPVNIVYPIDGATYPITNPPPGALSSAYFTSSFSVTCSGDHSVEWGFDSSPAVGQATFYDQISVQFVHKLPGGKHVFWVTTKNCGDSKVSFKIGNSGAVVGQGAEEMVGGSGGGRVHHRAVAPTIPPLPPARAPPACVAARLWLSAERAPRFAAHHPAQRRCRPLGALRGIH